MLIFCKSKLLIAIYEFLLATKYWAFLERLFPLFIPIFLFAEKANKKDFPFNRGYQSKFLAFSEIFWLSFFRNFSYI